MYRDHFGLSQAPFRITPDTRFFYAGGQRGQILDALLYAITTGEGVIKVIGEVGSGKTMLCRMLEAKLPGHVEIVYLANPSVSPENLPHAVAAEMALALDPAASRLETLHALQRKLLEKHAEGRQVVMFVEEAQSMSLATLEEIRLLSNLETQRDKLLQIVLFAQPELDHKLDAPQIRQLRERITHCFVLPPLDTEDIRKYVSFRMRAAGYRGPDVFTRGAYRALARRCEGLVRRANILADKSLLAAFAEAAHAVERRHVRAAIDDSEFRRRARPARHAALTAAATLLLGALLGGWAGMQGTRAPGGAPAPRGAVDARAAQAPAAKPPAAEAGAPVVLGSAARVGSERRAAPVPVAPREPAHAPRDGGWRRDAAAGSRGPSPVRPAPWAGGMPRPSASAPRTQASGFRDERSLLARRLHATRSWLARADADHFSIQLLMTDAPARDGLKSFLSARQRAGDIDDIYVFETTVRGKTWLGVLYKEYSTLKEAREALGRLTPELRRYQPFIRNIRDVAPAG